MHHEIKRWVFFFALWALFYLPLYLLSSANGMSAYDYLIQFIHYPWLLVSFSFILGIILMVIAENLARKLFLVHGESGRGSVKIIKGDDDR